jgi:membrane-bound lytic murein transglycosylase D
MSKPIGSVPVSSFAQSSLHQPFPSTPPHRTIQPSEEPSTPDLWDRIRSQLSWQDIDNRQVEQAVDGYLAQPEYLETIAERGSLYLYYIVDEVQKRNMPMEIALVPMVESTMDPMAYSPGQAAGLWQIMPSTGEHLGLQQDWWFDGRRAVRDSTQVALDYLEQLHEEFDNDWLLALAAYNAGEGRVARAQQENLKKGLPTDFWSLDLPRETRRYVPKVLALTQILAEPQTHEVELPPLPDEPAFEVAEIGSQVEFAKVAELADVNLETLRELNPGQLRWATAPNRSQELLVPLGTGARVEEEIAQLTPAERVRWRNYTIKPGDNLITIANRFHTTVALLQRVNHLHGSAIRAGANLMIPSSDWSTGMEIAEQNGPVGYTVRRGDSLYRIAGRYKVSVEDIVAWNSLDPRQYLKPGQTLTLHVGKR